MQAWRKRGGIVFSVPGEKYGEFEVPCGKCIGCKAVRGKEWAARCMHEAQMHEISSYVTLTYRDDDQVGLFYGHYQEFMQRMREFCGWVRFFMCGEYGGKTRRPHYHAILFGVHFEDRIPWKKTGNDAMLYQSDILNALWGHGDCLIGNVTFETAEYIGRYAVKKITGDPAEEHYTVITRYGEMVQIEPEFAHMSLKPGIGATWFEKYKDEVMNWDEIVVKGRKIKPPRYYDKILSRTEGFRWEEIQYERYLESLRWRDDNTPERLKVRETIQQQKLDNKKREFL
ncbi:replication initiator protein [robinz microvirus RP_36]|nr:replication initiator protein [robinz microvirus RP_36]